MKHVAAFVFAILIASEADARDTPGTPNNVSATASDANSIALGWHITSNRDELVKFEVEARENDAPVDVQQPDFTSGTDDGWLPNAGYVVSRLESEQHYCFRVWSRYADNDVRSLVPSAWACADTPAVPPLPPLDVRAEFHPHDTHVTLYWNTPDQTNHRPIKIYEIGRQSPPGPGRPTLIEGRVAGPNGKQDIKTQLAYLFRTKSFIKLPGNHLFWVCAINSGGETCAQPVVPAGVAPGAKVSGNSNIPIAAGAMTPSGPGSAPSGTSMVGTEVGGPSGKGPSGKRTSGLAGKLPHQVSAPAQCRAGYIQRLATQDDTVCVTAKAFDRIRNENQHADEHRDKSRPDACKNGYVRREATPEDHVCVTPSGRALAQTENGKVDF